jgi:hypothetical protein
LQIAETALSSGTTDTPFSPTEISPTETPTQSPTQVPTSLPIETQVPAPTIDSSQLSELEIRGLNTCILLNHWYPFSLTWAYDQNGCWELSGQGIYSQNSGIMLAYSTNSGAANGIYTSINQDVDIDFTIRVDKYAANQDKAGYLGFGIQSIDNLQSGPILVYYYLPSVSIKSLVPKILLDGYYSGQVFNSLSLSEHQHVKFSIRGNLLSIYLDGELCQSNLILPVSDRVFSIRYFLPSNSESEILAFIYDLTIR